MVNNKKVYYFDKEMNSTKELNDEKEFLQLLKEGRMDIAESIYIEGNKDWIPILDTDLTMYLKEDINDWKTESNAGKKEMPVKAKNIKKLKISKKFTHFIVVGVLLVCLMACTLVTYNMFQSYIIEKKSEKIVKQTKPIKKAEKANRFEEKESPIYKAIYSSSIYEDPSKESRQMEEIEVDDEIIVDRTQKNGDEIWGELDSGYWILIKDSYYKYFIKHS